MTLLDYLKVAVEIIAYISVAIFFLFKAFSGAFYVSLSLALNTDKRKNLNDKDDVLEIALTLTGGENAMLDIYKIEGKVTSDTFKENFNFEGVECFTLVSGNEGEVVPSWKIPSKTKYRIAPKGITSFSARVNIPKDAICKIEVIVVGRRSNITLRKQAFGQWRASQFSFPLNYTKEHQR
jgi:hypothetical protein